MAKKTEKKQPKPMKRHSYIRINDKLFDFDDFTPEQRKELSQKLNEQAARRIVLNAEDITA